MRDDIEFNTAFCKLVERHPVLYDYMRPDYCNRSAQEKTWRKIARELNENVQDCRDRWKNIRARYLKNIKQRSMTTDKTIKEYYLAQHLHFLYRFLKRGNRKKKLKQMVYKNSDEENVSHEESQRSLSSSPSLQQALPHFLTLDGTQTSLTIDGTRTELFPDRHKDMQIHPDLTLDPDMAFLQSLLPDMKAMADDQKRKFKIGVLNMAGEILESSKLPIPEIKIEDSAWSDAGEQN